MLHMTNLSQDLIYLPWRYMSSMLRNSKFVFRITWKTEEVVYVHESTEFTTNLFSKVSTRKSLPYVQIKEKDIISRKSVYGVRNIFVHHINYFLKCLLVWIYVLHKKYCLEKVPIVQLHKCRTVRILFRCMVIINKYIHYIIKFRANKIQTWSTVLTLKKN